jgi:hypothetical protein
MEELKHVDTEMKIRSSELDYTKYREAIEHFKKNPYLKEAMEEIEKLEKKVNEHKA